MIDLDQDFVAERSLEMLIREGVISDETPPTRRIAIFDDAFARVGLDFFNRAISTLLSLDKPRLAGEFLVARFRMRGAFDNALLSQTLSKLSEGGFWFERNELLLTYSLNYSLKDLNRFITIFLDQLDINRADRAFEALREIETTEVCIPLLVSLAIARGDDDAAMELLDADSFLINRLMENFHLSKWLYLLAGRRPEFLDKLIEKLKGIKLEERLVMSNMSNLIKALSALQQGERLRQFILAWSFDPAVEILKKDVVFCRSYLFICDKLGVLTKLLEKIHSYEGGIFCEDERRAIEFKRTFYREGLEIAFRNYYTVPVIEVKQKYLEIPLIVYGETYLRTLRDYFLESVTTSQEFIELPRSYQCTISICTTPDYVEEIKEILRPLSELGFQIDFPSSFLVTVEKIEHYRMVFLTWCTYRVELQGGILIVMCPDSLLGHGLRGLIERCPAGGGAGGVLVRVSWSAVEKSRALGEIKTILLSTKRNALLAGKAHTDWRHFCSHLFFNNISENHRSIIKNSYQYNSWHGVSTVLKPSPGFTELLLSLSCYRYSNVYSDHFAQPHDHELIGHLAKLGLLYMPDKAEEFVFLELAKDAGYTQLWKFQCPMGYPENPPFGRIFS